jgi:uncharacterized membrane protein
VNTEDPLQQNIRRSTGLHALKQIGRIVEQDNNSEAAKAGFLRWILRYGWIALLLVVAVLARLTGVY